MAFRFLKSAGSFSVFLVALFSLCFSASVVGAADEAVKVASADRPAWLDKLEKQIDYEEMMSGLQGRREKVERTFRDLKRQFGDQVKNHATPASAGGLYHDSWAVPLIIPH